ncbi:hypothetical protein JCM21900_001622 [Sporobolomyces salmonicolor]
MSKAPYDLLPTTASGPHHPRSRPVRLFVVPVVLAVFALVHLTRSQLLFPANNVQTPFELHSDRLHTGGKGSLWEDKQVPRIAIIGAGAGGSSAAYFLSHFAKLKELGLETLVTIYDENDYVGGRSTVIWPWQNDPYEAPGNVGDDPMMYEAPVELGASIFVEANKNLQKAMRVFNLTYDAYGGEDGEMAIWDGEQFVYTEAGGWGWGWWDKTKMLWRYGRSPFTARSLVQSTVKGFLSLYSPDFISRGAFSSIANFSAAIDLESPAAHLASDYFREQGVNSLFTNELIAAATTVNYGSPIDQIHGVGALVSLAATGAVSIRGGNRQIFESFVGSSGARLRLGSSARVTELLKLDASNGKRAKWIVKTASGEQGGTYDAVIIAAPYHQTGIRIVNSATASLIPKQPYVNLHVTFVLTNTSMPQPSYFDLPAKSSMPNMIFGTFNTASKSKPTFNSLNYLKPLPASIGSRFGEGEVHVVKMFSSDTLDVETLNAIYGAGSVLKVIEKVWKAYPKLEPILSPADLAPVRPDEGLYYVNAFERLVSTMETETVSSFNVVSLLLNDFYDYTPPTSWAEWDDQA